MLVNRLNVIISIHARPRGRVMFMPKLLRATIIMFVVVVVLSHRELCRFDVRTILSTDSILTTCRIEGIASESEEIFNCVFLISPLL